MNELDLKDIFSIFWRKKEIILIVTIIFFKLGEMYSYNLVVPKYKSSTTLVLASVSDNGQTSSKGNAITQTKLTLNSNLVSTYSELIKSKTVLRQVIDNLSKEKIEELDVEDLKESINVRSVSGTELIEISVVNENAEYACEIANEIANVFSSEVADIYNINNVHVVDKAEVEKEPYNINHKKDIIISTVLGFSLSVLLVLIINIMDNTIKTEQDVEKATGMMVLAQVPKFNSNPKRGGKK